ncbi:hypothetical protein TNCV_1519021 [Trichonephila clavipes]|nr:hypothetical protein TNCV_1519021 [Trichonephila clavipes]
MPGGYYGLRDMQPACHEFEPSGTEDSDGKTKRSAESQLLPITNSREDRHTTHMAFMNRAVPSRALSQELGSYARPNDLPFIQARESLLFSRIMQDCMMPVLYGPSLIWKKLYCCPGQITNRKRLVYGCRATASSPYASHYS